MRTVTVKAVCHSCHGTGLYNGMCEETGHPVVCISCRGTGCEEITYEPFVERKVMRGVKGVRLSKGCFIGTGVGSVGDEVSYNDFISGKLNY